MPSSCLLVHKTSPYFSTNIYSINLFVTSFDSQLSFSPRLWLMLLTIIKWNQQTFCVKHFEKVTSIFDAMTEIRAIAGALLLSSFLTLISHFLSISLSCSSIRAHHGIRRTKEMKRFMLYSLYAWGFPFVMVSSVVLFSHIYFYLN